MPRAARNRTITLDESGIRRYASLCPRAYSPGMGDAVLRADAFDVLPALPAGFADLLIADPPYNLRKTYGDSAFRKMGEGDYAAFTRAWLEAARHTLKPTASVYVCSDWRSSMVIGNILGEYFTVRNRITWQRDKGRGAKKNWKNAMEDIWFATVSPKNYAFNAQAVMMRRRVIAPYRAGGRPKGWVEGEAMNFRDTCPSNFWDDITVPYWSMPENTDHPAQKPEKLYAKLILASSNPGDMILDPFAGAGTAAVAAKKLGRGYLCVEREEAYCALAQRRLEAAGENAAIQGYTGGVFWERNTMALQNRRSSS
ncbi:MAG: site-specific DNA-methyltransferase [Oscillospiraceae bacterium]|nr:site-specific DNA-methyltransferase [Oscillospiraceae bacterium]